MALLGTSLFTDANLKSYYQLEDTSDSKGSNTLTNHNSVTFTAAKFGNGANLGTSNTTKFLDVANAISYNGGAFTIVGWVKILTEPSNAAYGLFDVKDGTTSHTALGCWYNDTGGTKTIQFNYIKIGGATTTQSYSSGALGTTNFHHLAIIYDGANIYGYFDNTQSSTTGVSGNGAGGADQSVIGGDQNGNQLASALIDDVAYFNRALTASDINILFNDIQAGGIKDSYSFFL